MSTMADDQAPTDAARATRFVDKSKRFKLLPAPRRRDREATLLLAADTLNGDVTVVIKMYASEQLRDNAVNALTTLRDERYVATFADPEDRAACVFNARKVQPTTPYAVALQKGDSSLKDALNVYESLDLSDTRAVMEKVLAAVGYMHSQGWVHCALTTATVVEFKNLTYKLIEFDLAAKMGEPIKDVPAEVCPPEVAGKLAAGEAVPACWSIDSWSLGCLFFHLLMGAPLIHFLVPGAQEMSRRELLAQLAALQQPTVDRVIEPIVAHTPKINYKNAWSLMDKLLKISKDERCKPADTLTHVFFQGGIASDLPGANRVSPQLDLQLGDVGRRMGDVRDLMEEAQRNFQRAANLANDMAERECPATFVILPEGPGGAAGGGGGGKEASLEQVATWASNLVSWFKSPPSTEEVARSLAAQQVRLYLVCELSGQPQGQGYPITKPNEKVAKLLPAMQMGMKLLKAANGAAKVARCFFPVGLPSIPQNLMDKAQSTIEALDAKSSVEDFACVRGALDGGSGGKSGGGGKSEGGKGEQRTQLVGGSIREFRAFLLEVDPRNLWAGLQRFVTQDGHVLWVSAAAAAEALQQKRATGVLAASGASGGGGGGGGGSNGGEKVANAISSGGSVEVLVTAVATDGGAGEEEAVPAAAPAAAVTNLGVRPAETDDERALLEASFAGNVAAVQSLMDKSPVNPNVTNKAGYTSLALAAKESYVAVMEVLLAHGACTTAMQGVGLTPLHVACLAGQVAAVELLVQHGAEVSVRSKIGTTPLHVAAREGHLEVVTLLLGRISGTEDLAAVDHDGCTPLLLAAARGHLAVVRALLQRHGAGVHIANNAQSTPLHLASHRGHRDVAEMLLQHKAAVDAVNKHGSTPLLHACARGHTEVAELLLKHGAKVDVRDNDLWTPLHEACAWSHAGVAALLVNHPGIDLEAMDKDDCTPLHLACKDCCPDLVQLLLAAGADVEAEDKDIATPLHEAVRKGSGQGLEVLLAKGARVDARDKYGSTPLHVASKHGNLAAVQLLCSQGAAVGAADEDGITPLHLACKGGALQVVTYLLQRGAEVAARDKEGAIPLHVACAFGHKEVVSLLLEKTVNGVAAVRDKDGATPLHLAAAWGDKEVVNLLVRAGAGVAARNKYGCTPLHAACAAGKKEVVEYLMRRGADVAARDRAGCTPLHAACARGHREVAEVLLRSAGADVKAADGKYGNTPLHWACAWGHAEVAELLLAHGAKVDEINKMGSTPLHDATAWGRQEVVALLLEREADVTIRDEAGKTAMRLAKEGGQVEILQMLQKAAATDGKWTAGEVVEAMVKGLVWLLRRVPASPAGRG